MIITIKFDKIFPIKRNTLIKVTGYDPGKEINGNRLFVTKIEILDDFISYSISEIPGGVKPITFEAIVLRCEIYDGKTTFRVVKKLS